LSIFKSIKALIIGHFTVIKHMFKKAVTKEYPEERPIVNNFFRGKHVLKNCTGCGYCKKVCPAGAIEVIKKDKDLVGYVIDYNKCIFCGNCMFYCPTKSITLTNEFELATDNKSDLKIDLLEQERTI